MLGILLRTQFLLVISVQDLANINKDSLGNQIRMFYLLNIKLNNKFI